MVVLDWSEYDSLRIHSQTAIEVTRVGYIPHAFEKVGGCVLSTFDETTTHSKNEAALKAQLQNDKSDAGVASPASQQPSPETMCPLFKNQAGPKAQLQGAKSNAGVTSPISQHPSSETITISH